MGHRPWQRHFVILVMAIVAVALVGTTLISSFQWIRKPFPGFFLHENLTIGPYFLPHWTGAVAGLRSLDRVVAVEGESLDDRTALYRRIKDSAPGETFQYTVARGSSTFDVAIPSMTLSFNNWFLTFGLYVVIGLAFLVIGLAPYYYQATSPAAFPLCFMVLAVFVWFESTFDFMTWGYLPKEIRNFALLLTPSAGIHLAWLLKTGKPLRRSHPALLVALYGVAIALGWINSVTFFGPLEQWSRAFRAGYAFTFFGAFAFLAIIGSALRGELESLERSRLRVMFGGAVLGFLLPTFGTVLTSSFHWPIPYNVALLPTVFFPLSVAYALLKYSLFDLGNALKIALTRVALTALLLIAYAALVLLIGPWMGSYDNDALIALFFSIVVVLVFNPLLRWVEGVVARYVYRQDYDPRQVQEEVSLFLRSLARSPEVAAGFLKRLTARMSITSASLAYRPKESQEWVAIASSGTAPAVALVAPAVNSLAGIRLTLCYHAIARGEVMTNPHFHAARQSLLQLFEEMSCELLIPIIFEREVRGVVCFGFKGSRKEYSADDLRLLMSLTDQLALSLENGRLFEESVRAYDKAEAMNRKLIEMDRVKKQFVANICHELRTPVSTIIGYSEILLDRDYTGNRQSLLERLVHNGQQLSGLMDDLLNFSRMEADGVSTHFEQVKLADILKAVEMMTQRLIRKRPIEFHVTMDPALETIESDGQKIQQILAQLLTNAVKFTEKGRIELSVRKVGAARGEWVEIAVADSGIGIREEDQELIFEEFRQLDGSSTRQYSGTGLGLSLCRKLASALGGSIEVKSQMGIGSVFRLLLPVDRSGADRGCTDAANAAISY